jgi:probable phosphoglycerate mutase
LRLGLVAAVTIHLAIMAYLGSAHGAEWSQLCNTVPEVPSTILLLVRHGHTRDNTVGDGARLSGWHDPPLSPLGAQQARLLATSLRSERVAALYTSTLTRARQTAATLADALGLEPIDEPDLREISCGDLDGRSLATVQRRFPELWQRNLSQSDADFRWPGGESYRELRLRVLGALHASPRGTRGSVSSWSHTPG